jgi:hypothetical protein
MDLVAGDVREVLLAISIDDWAGLQDRRRFCAHISLGGGMEPSWLDHFAHAAREMVGGGSPGPFSDATRALQSRLVAMSERTVERVDPHWIDDVAGLPDDKLDRIAARWIDLIHCEECGVDSDEKPMLRALAGDLVEFCRSAQSAEDVLFAWTI